MPFNSLILSSITPNRSFTESGKTVSVSGLQRGEESLFFIIDSESNSSSTIREDFKIKGSICDLIIYYYRLGKKVICFTELKGSDVAKAIEQVENTKKYFDENLKNSIKSKKCRECDIKYKAYILKHGSSPRNLKLLCKEIADKYGRNNFRVSSESNIISFLREN